MANVLVVDSCPGVRMFTQVVFRDAGHRVRLVDDAEQALIELSTDRFELAVVGDPLPGRSPLDLLQAVDDFDVAVRTRLALHTADRWAVDELAVRGLAVDVVARPAGSGELLALTRLAPGLALA